tara:strand:- start:353 stop:754 length:402 start_codon:yes stop_codon:yes gene_type:complete
MIRIRVGKAKMIKGAFVVILDEKDRALTLLRPDWVGWGPNKWCYPGGQLERGETPEQAAVRETKEETTLDVSGLKEADAGGHPVKAYYTRDYAGDVEIDFEHEDWQWMSREDMDEHPMAPGVIDMFDWVVNNE